MRESLLDILVDPVSRAPLALVVDKASDGDEVREGTLRAPDGRSFRVSNGIPRFVLTNDEQQLQSADSFGYKWKQQQSYGSPGSQEFVANWLVQRYGFRDRSDMRQYFASRRLTLDAGCGGGMSAASWLDGSVPAPWVGADISEGIDVARERLSGRPDTEFVQADILQLPFRDGAFQTIISEGVLHHTPSTEKALKSLVPLLEPGGELMFYVYRKKAPVREFVDDHVREELSKLPPEEAWAALRPLTELGKTLAELGATVEIKEALPYLGIKPGKYDLQRFVYWHIMKLFWNETYSFEENNHINFDWYHPKYAHRQTEEEVRRWCAESGLLINRFHVEESGFTVRAIKCA